MHTVDVAVLAAAGAARRQESWATFGAHGLPRFPSPTPLLPRKLGRPLRKRRGVALVLIVDDSLDVREMYSQYLTHRGFSVISAPNGPQGIDLALAERPDVIIMDIAMPNMTGTTATQRLKSHPRTRKIPVVILTGHPDSAIEQGALEAGAARMLTKPCLPEDLEGHVRSLLQLPPAN
jgi:two-component system, cell cycle response regulator DivK